MLVAEGSWSGRAPARPLRVLVVDDHEVIRSGLRWLLTRVPWVERCATAAGVEEAVRLAVGCDVALVDVGLGLRACERLTAAAPELRTALLTSRWDLVSMRTARAAGAYGAIAKDRPAGELLAAVHALARGAECDPEPVRPGEFRFIPREREILQFLGAGLTNAEIGAAMFLAPGTIKHHILEIYVKLGARNRAAAVHAARRLGVLADEREDAPEPTARLRVLVADAHDVRRTGVLLALQGRPWVAACRGARSAADALAAAEQLRPDIALVGDPDIARALAPLRTLPLRDDGTVAVESSGTGHPAVSPRERDVLAAFAAGDTNPAIARELGLSPNTVKQHASSIFRKLGVRNRAEAVRRADELGLLAA